MMNLPFLCETYKLGFVKISNRENIFQAAIEEYNFPHNQPLNISIHKRHPNHTKYREEHTSVGDTKSLVLTFIIHGIMNL